MIVVDTNIISYLLLPTSYSDSVDSLYKMGADWSAPTLWKSEFRNVLALYLRKKIIRVVPFDNLLIFRIFLSSICQLRGQRTGLLRKLIDS